MNNDLIIRLSACVQQVLQGHRDHGAVGGLVIGIVIGVLLVVFGIIKFLIPGE